VRSNFHETSQSSQKLRQNFPSELSTFRGHPSTLTRTYRNLTGLYRHLLGKEEQADELSFVSYVLKCVSLGSVRGMRTFHQRYKKCQASMGKIPLLADREKKRKTTSSDIHSTKTTQCFRYIMRKEKSSEIWVKRWKAPLLASGSPNKILRRGKIKLLGSMLSKLKIWRWAPFFCSEIVLYLADTSQSP
jgi:hypothetical protein